MTKYDSTIHHRRSIRLKGYDYSDEGMYFITVCAKNRECVFGRVVDDRVRLSRVGRIADQYWTEIPTHFPRVELDQYVVMPNHIHGIIIINRNTVVGVRRVERLRNEFQRIIPGSIGSIVRSYKAAVTTWRRKNGFLHFSWQRNYYEHIIHNERAFNRVQKYIINNPFQWSLGEENPEPAPESGMPRAI